MHTVRDWNLTAKDFKELTAEKAFLWRLLVQHFHVRAEISHPHFPLRPLSRVVN